MRLLLFLMSLCFCCFSFAQRVDPNDVKLICSNQLVTGKTTQSISYTNLRTSCGQNRPLSSALALYYIEIVSGTTFTFTISPQGPLDYDFAAWKNPDFSNLGPSDRGSQNDGVNTGLYDTGLSLTETMLCEIPGAMPGTGAATVPGFVRYFDVQPGDGILIAINRFSIIDAGFDLTFGGDAILNCDIFTKTYEVCDIDHKKEQYFDLNEIKQEINNSTNTFTIDFFDNSIDASNINATNTIPNPYKVNILDSPKKIYARYTRSNGLFVKTREIILIVNETPKDPENHLIYNECAIKVENNQSFAYFDLTKFEKEFQKDHINLIKFSYFEKPYSSSETEISNPKNFLSSNQTIVVKMTINDKCPVEFPLTLKVNDKAKKTTENFISEICTIETKNNKPIAIFDLTQYETKIQEENDSIIDFNYYKGEIVSAENKINNPKNYTASEEIITAVMTIKDLCPVKFTITIKANKIDIDSSDITYSEYCAQESETGLIYNLENTLNILLQNKSKEPYTIDYYLTSKDAKDEENKIQDSTDFLLTYNTNQTIYVRISDKNGCYVISTIQLHSKPRFRLEDQVNEKCEPFLLPELPKEYDYYTEPNKKGNKIIPSTLESILYGPKELYIYGEDNYGLPALNNCFFETSFTIATNGCMISRGISPNGDNINDYFDLKSYGVIKLSIFNRYGTEVYSKSNYIDEWHGQNNNNKLLPVGTYMYYFESVKGQFTGWIELMY